VLAHRFGNAADMQRLPMGLSETRLFGSTKSRIVVFRILPAVVFSKRSLSYFRATTAAKMKVITGKLPYWKAEDVDGNDKDLRVLAPLVICGPSGICTRAIIKRFLMEYGDQFVSVVSHTTRKSYDGEINGIDYYFVTEIKFNEMIFLDAFFEHAEVHGHMLGMTFDSIFKVHESGGPPRCEIMDVDAQGVKFLKKNAITFGAKSNKFKLRPKYVFIAPPDLVQLKYRLIVRDTESEDEIRLRLKVAKQEIEYGTSLAFDAVVYHVEMDQAVRDFADVVTRLYNNFDVTEAIDIPVDPQDSDDGILLRRNLTVKPD
jgi:guanylate kinase